MIVMVAVQLNEAEHGLIRLYSWARLEFRTTAALAAASIAASICFARMLPLHDICSRLVDVLIGVVTALLQ